MTEENKEKAEYQQKGVSSMRVGMLTSGGDCQSLNATMRGVAKALYKMYEDVEIVGFEDGYKGLIYADYHILKPSDFPAFLRRAVRFWVPPDSRSS